MLTTKESDPQPMAWSDHVLPALKAAGIRLVSYVPDKPLVPIIDALWADPEMETVNATREEEALAIASGAYLAGAKSCVMMQVSGLGNCVNALASLNIPQTIPVLLLITERGGLGEFNCSQVPMGRAARPILDTLGIQHWYVEREEDVEPVLTGAVPLCYAGRVPLAVIFAQRLTGGE